MLELDVKYGALMYGSLMFMGVYDDILFQNYQFSGFIFFDPLLAKIIRCDLTNIVSNELLWSRGSLKISTIFG